MEQNMEDTNLLILIDMGFDEPMCKRALRIYNDDLQACVAWIMMKNSLGSMPKRFKRGRDSDFNYTFINSVIEFSDGSEYYVQDFDSTFNIILLQRYGEQMHNKWVPLGDPNITWIDEKHDSKPNEYITVPQHYNKMGTIKIPYNDAFTLSNTSQNHLSDNEKAKWNEPMIQELKKTRKKLMTFGNLINLYDFSRIRLCKNPNLGYLWKCIFSTSDKYDEKLKITPMCNEPEPVSDMNVERIRHQSISKIYMIIEICDIQREDFDFPHIIRHFNQCLADINKLEVEEHVKKELTKQFKRYSKTKKYIRNKRKKWNEGCASACRYVLENMTENYIEMSVMVHNHLFTAKQFQIIKRSIFHKLSMLKYIFDAFEMKNNLIDNYPESINLIPEEISSRHIPLFNGYTCLRITEWNDILLKWATKKSENHSAPINDLLPHQKQLFNWMLHKEQHMCNNQGTICGWEKNNTPTGMVYYRSVLIGTILNSNSYMELIRNKSKGGGIISQAVGSGKTRTVLEFVKYQKKYSKHGSGKTLVVMPTTMLSTWEKECRKWTPELISCVYHGNRRKINPEADIIFTTYRTVCTECHPTSANIKHDDLMKYEWSRIILDEGHQIRDNRTRSFKALLNLKTVENSYKWIITATPIIKNGGTDLTAYFEFMDIHPYCDDTNHSFQTYMWAILTFAENYPHMGLGLKKFISNIIFFQDKETISKMSDIQKPSVIEKDELIIPDVRHLYYLKKLKEMFTLRLEKDSTAMQMRLRFTNWMRLAANTPDLIPLASYGLPMNRKTSCGMTIVSKTADNLNLGCKHEETLKTSLKDIDKQNCPICLDSIDSPTVTSCGHLFCSDCINAAFNATMNRVCPCCRTNLNNTTLREIVSESKEETNGDIVTLEHASLGVNEINKKDLEELKSPWINPKIKILLNWFKNNDEKCLVFTTLSSSVMNSISKNLDRCGIKSVSISGNMTQKQRSKAIERFQNDKTCRAFILTARSASYGLTLTAASTLIFFEPCMNKSLKEQCIGRMDRLGQKKKSLKVITFAVKDSIENDLLNISKEKNSFTFKDIGLL